MAVTTQSIEEEIGAFAGRLASVEVLPVEHDMFRFWVAVVPYVVTRGRKAANERVST